MITDVQYDRCKSRFIEGLNEKSRAAAEVCLRDASLRRFWAGVIRAIRGSSRGDRDGEIFTSDELEVCLGPYDVEVKHRCRWIERTGGDSYMGRFEEYAELEEDFEVVAAREGDRDGNLPELAAVLDAYYRNNRLRLHNCGTPSGEPAACRLRILRPPHGRAPRNRPPHTTSF